MAPLWLMQCLWQEQNAQSFDDCEIGLLDLTKLVLHTLYTWRVAWTTSSVYTFSEFLDLCSFFSMVEEFSCVLPVYVGCVPFCF